MPRLGRYHSPFRHLQVGPAQPSRNPDPSGGRCEIELGFGSERDTWYGPKSTALAAVRVIRTPCATLHHGAIVRPALRYSARDCFDGGNVCLDNKADGEKSRKSRRRHKTLTSPGTSAREMRGSCLCFCPPPAKSIQHTNLISVCGRTMSMQLVAFLEQATASAMSRICSLSRRKMGIGRKVDSVDARGCHRSVSTGSQAQSMFVEVSILADVQKSWATHGYSKTTLSTAWASMSPWSGSFRRSERRVPGHGQGEGRKKEREAT